MRSCHSAWFQGLAICLLLQAMGCQQQEPYDATRDAQADRSPVIHVRSLSKAEGQRWYSGDPLEFYDFIPSTGGFKHMGAWYTPLQGFFSLASYAAPGGRLHFAEIAAYEFGLVFVPSTATLHPMQGMDEWHLPNLHVARGRCPVFVPGQDRRLVPLVDKQGQAVELTEGDGIFVSEPEAIYGSSSQPFEWTVFTGSDEPKVVWVSQHCLDPLLDYKTMVPQLYQRAKEIALEAADEIQRYKAATASLGEQGLASFMVREFLHHAIQARLTVQSPPTLAALRQEIAQLREILARQHAYPWEGDYPTAPITLSELRLLLSAEVDAHTGPVRIGGLYVNETQVLTRSTADPHVFESQPPHGIYGGLFTALPPVYPARWLEARNRLADALSQDVMNKNIDAQLAYRFQGEYAYDFGQCVSQTSCPAPRAESLFLTNQVPYAPEQPTPLSLLGSIMIDLAQVFNIEFFLADGSERWSQYVINTGLAREVYGVPGLAEIGHIHPNGARALSASFILPKATDGDRVYFDNKDEPYALDHVGKGSDLCAQFLDQNEHHIVFLPNGMAVRHELPVSAEQQLVTLPIRTTYGHVMVSVDPDEPCWQAAYAGFPQAPPAPEPLQ